MRKHPVDNLHFDMECCANRHDDCCPNGAFGIDWSCELGCGRWEVVFDEQGKPHISTEYMDSQDDKSFSEALLKAFLEQAVIEE